jgi:preprotein translocase subunit SecA
LQSIVGIGVLSMVEAVFTEEEKKNLKELTEEFPKLRSEIESLKETLEILSDKELMADIEQGKKDVAEGRVYTFEEALKELGIDEDEL